MRHSPAFDIVAQATVTQIEFLQWTGADHHFSCFVDFKKVWLSVNAHGLLSGETPAVAHIQLNPPLVSVGFKYQFGRRPR
jgi:hypothetical protein